MVNPLYVFYIPIQVFHRKGEEITPTLSPQICIKSVDGTLALAMETAAAEFHKNIECVPVITSAIYQLLGAACQRQRQRVVSHKYQYIREGIELMENNSDLTLTEIAAVCGVSEGHFRKLFREYSGENPAEFRQKYRVEKAKQLLLLDTHSIGEIAESLGISGGTVRTRLSRGRKWLKEKLAEKGVDVHG